MKTFVPRFVWFDGKFVRDEEAKVSVMTHAIHYGTSVFEGLRGYWNSRNLNIFRLYEHIERFRNSGKVYSVSLRFKDKEIANAIIQLCKKNNVKESCYIRPFYFVGRYGINLHVTEDSPTHAAIVMFPFGDLFNKNGITAKVITYGAILTELHVPDRNGHSADVVLGFDTLAGYLKGHPFFGATVGRVANQYYAAGGKLDMKTLRESFKRHQKEGKSVYQEQKGVVEAKARQNKANLEQLGADYKAGRITQAEYERQVLALK